ncbi:MAG: DUF927 domain-containing protein, partial [Planctomycetaceae bacterium]|nr:DUF927 domain-containing protein [Planctomycetaceae bacterium]
RVEDGHSATTGHEGRDVFHVFSNEARPFAPNESYSKFQAYALLKHGGDESKAAAELYKAGYGTRQPPPPPTDDDRPGWYKDRAGFLDDVPPGPPMNGRHDPGANGWVATPEPEPGIVAALIEEAKTFRSELEVLSAEDFLSACARLDRKGLDRVAAVIKDRKLGPRAFRRAVAAGRPKWAGTAGAADHPYVEHGDETYMTFVTKEGEIAERRIADFTARIVREVERHEAGERRFQFEIEATHRTGVVARATVDAEQYAKMGWVESLGSLFKVMEGRGDRGHLKLAIQFLSWQEADVPRETVYTSMGWIEHEGEWLYLHAGGALGAFGPSDAVRVEVPGPFARYTLPDSGEGPEEIRAAIAACFGILALAKADRPGAAAVAAILATLPWRAPLGPSDFTIHFGGGSGNYKTSAAKIACQHFAPGVDRNSKPPFTWESTAASLQRSAFDGADTVLLIDELTGERALEIGTAFIQAQGNLKGKDRSTSNMGSAAGLDPRGSPLSTGEVDLTRQSAQGRSLAVRFTQGMIDKAVLETLQDAADSGRYATAMAAYLRWLAGRIEDARRAHKKTVAGLAKTIRRETEGDAVHPRHPGIVAELGAAYSLFLEFAVEQGACDRATADAYAGTVRTYLMDLLREQGDIQRELGPGRRFLTLLRAGLGAKYYHLQAAHDDNAPTPYASECGWHKDWVYQGKDVGSVLEWKIPPNSKAIGFIDVPDGFVYLNRQMAMEVARAMGDRQGTPFENVAGLARDLADAKLIMTVKEGEKTRYEVQRRIRGTKDRFLALQLEQVFGPPEG